MATLSWVGGGSNQASDPNDWVDTSTNLPAAPQTGDTLSDTIDGSTINITDNALAGNGLSPHYS